MKFDISHTRILSLALPMIAVYLSTPLVGIADSALIGRFGTAAELGAVAVGAILFDLVFASFNFLKSSTTGLTAQSLGRKAQHETLCILIRATLLAWLTGMTLVLLQKPIATFGLKLLGTSGHVYEAAFIYVAIRIWSAPCNLANYALLGSLVGVGRTGLCLAVATLLNGSNILLSIFCVYYLQLGIAGIAWGTVAAEVIAMIAAMIIHLFLHRNTAWPSWHELLQREKIRRFAVINGNTMVRTFSLIFCFSFFTSQGARQGEIILAANAVLMHFFFFSGYFLDGFASAAELLAGRSIGARWRVGFIRSVQLTLFWGTVLAAITTLLYIILGAAIIDLMTTIEPVRQTARIYLWWAVMTPLAGILAFQMDGIFLGATWSREVRNMMILSMVLFLGACFLLPPYFGNHGLWAALLIFLGIRGLSLLVQCAFKIKTEPAFIQQTSQ